jgi:flagellar hook-associated protein 2
MVLRISGLASGMDVDTTISQLMKARKVPVDLLAQKKQTLQWQFEGFREMNTKLADFRSSKLSSYRLESTYSAKKSEITGPGASAISAKVTGLSQAGQIMVDVDKLATNAIKQGNLDIRKITNGIPSDFDPSKPLLEQSQKLDGGITDSTFELKVNGTTIKVTPKTQSLNNIISQINSNTKVNAFYDTQTGKLSYTSKETGLSAAIDFSGSEPGLLTNVLKTALDTGSSIPKGEDAIVKINGLATTRSSNTFTVNGVEITLNQPGDLATIAVKTDTDKIVDNIKNFIKDYNDMLKVVQDKVGEPRYKDFAPLTDDQKKDMKDTDIEKWEKMSKSGMLKNDTILNGFVGSMRSISTSKVQNGFDSPNNLNSLGIVTGAYTDKGKLYLNDEVKLRAAIEKNPDAVISLFTARGNDDSDTSDVGLAQRLYDSVNSVIKQISQKVGNVSLDDSTAQGDSLLGKQIYDMSKRIDTGNKKLQKYEDQYYRQFSAMETAMNKYNSQGTYLQNAFSSGNQ